MIPHYAKKANLGILVGIVLSLGVLGYSYTLTPPVSSGTIAILSLIRLVGTAIFIYGCVMYALAKGRSGWWGAFGLLSLIGLIVLVCLKDYAADGYAAQQRGFSPIMRNPNDPTPRA